MERTENLITTYMERSLHASLKAKFCPDESCHEVKIGRFVSDACCDGVIYEIQTGNLAPLAKKIRFYLENTNFEVVVVRPIAKDRRIFWLGEGGELSSAARKSSRHENIFHGIADLWYLREIFGAQRRAFAVVLMEIDEIRLLDGYGKDKKKRATSVDRLAGEIFSEIRVHNLDDVRAIARENLPTGEFYREDLARALKLSGLKLWAAQKFFVEFGILSCEKEGKRLVFKVE